MRSGAQQDAQQTPLSNTYATEDFQQFSYPQNCSVLGPQGHFIPQGFNSSTAFAAQPSTGPLPARTSRKSWRSGAAGGTHPASTQPPSFSINPNQQQPPPRYFHPQQHHHLSQRYTASQQQATVPFSLPFPSPGTAAAVVMSSPQGFLPTGRHAALPTAAGPPSFAGLTPCASSRPTSSLDYNQAIGWGGQSLGPGRPKGRGGLHHHAAGPRGRGGGRMGSGFDDGLSSQQADAVILRLIDAIRGLPPNVPCLDTAVASGLGTLDSRSAAVFLKQLARANMVNRAWELFNGLCAMQAAGTAGELLGLLDVYSYTAMISLCSNNREVALAQELSREMVALGIQRNVHTFSALMNVAIKASQYQLALDIFEDMQAAGCQPNLVTFNTLIDVYGKLNKWTEAVRVVNSMRAMGIEPVIRTYNTLMIACNSSNQWQEALRVYQQVVESGLRPNTTTFNALITAYSKSGNLDKVMEVFQQMVRSGCERSVITYSTLISACEKAGEWELALQLFGRMPQDGVRPNTITFNSVITACAQGSQWDRAEEVFEQMGRLSCQPDVVSYTALITAYGRGAQWRRALDTFARMHRARCTPDHVVYEAVIEVLWETGVNVAQKCAVSLYRASMKQGLARQQQQAGTSLPQLRPIEGRPEPVHENSPDRAVSTPQSAQHVEDATSSATGSQSLRGTYAISMDMGAGGASSMSSDSQLGGQKSPSVATATADSAEGRSRSLFAESQPAAMSAAVQQLRGGVSELLLGASSSSNMAIICLLCWLADARESVRQQGPGCLPKRLIIRFGRTRQRELAPSGATLRTIVLGWLKSHRSPFRFPADASVPASASIVNMLEASGADVEAWLSSPTTTSGAAASSPPTTTADDAGRGARLKCSVGDALARSLNVFCTPAADGHEDPQQMDAINGDLALEVQCCTAFSAVQRFEACYCLNVTAMGPAYVASRHDLVMSFFKVGAKLHCRRNLLHDAVLLLDRVMSSAVQPHPDMHLPALCAALLIVARQPAPPGLPISLPSTRQHGTGSQPSAPSHPAPPKHSAVSPPAVASALTALPGGQGAAAAAAAATWKEGKGGELSSKGIQQGQEDEDHAKEGIPSEASLLRITGITASSLRTCQSTICNALAHDTAAISAVHSLEIYLARLGLATNRWQVMRDDGIHNILPQKQQAQHPLLQQQQTLASAQPQSQPPPHDLHSKAPQATTQQALDADSVAASTSGLMRPTIEPSLQHAAAAVATVLGSPSPGSGDLEWDAYSLLDAAVAAPNFLNFRPSVTAAAVLYAARMRAGELPLWPSSLAAVTGTRSASVGGSGSSNPSGLAVEKNKAVGGLGDSGVELSAAISAAQELLVGLDLGHPAL